MKQASAEHYRFVSLLYIFFLAVAWVICISIDRGREVFVINGLHNLFWDVFFTVITNLGDGIVFVPFILFFLFNRVYLSLGLLVNAIGHGMIVTIFKRVLFSHAERPVNILDTSLLYFVPDVEVHRLMSFPSGHTATIFGLTVFFSLYYKNKTLAVFLFLLASSVGVSRIYLLQHFGLDVIAGGFIGACVAMVTYHSFERLTKPEWMLQGIHFKSPDNTNRRFS